MLIFFFFSEALPPHPHDHIFLLISINIITAQYVKSIVRLKAAPPGTWSLVAFFCFFTNKSKRCAVNFFLSNKKLLNNNKYRIGHFTKISSLLTLLHHLFTGVITVLYKNCVNGQSGQMVFFYFTINTSRTDRSKIKLHAYTII